MIGKWKGPLVDNLSVSIGSASSAENEELSLDRLDDFTHIADKKCMWTKLCSTTLRELKDNTEKLHFKYNSL